MDTGIRKARISRKAKESVGKPSLAASNVHNLPTGTYGDRGQRGLQLRVTKNKRGTTRSWLLRFKYQNEESRILLGHFPALTLEAARREAQALRDKAAEGIDPRRAKARRIRSASPLPASAAVTGGAHTVEFLVSEFIERHLKPNQLRPEYSAAILNKNVLAEWPGRDARTIEPHEVIALLDGVVDRGSRVMANRVAGILGQLFKFGIHRGIVKASPVQLLYRPGGKEKPRDRTLTDAELATYLKDPVAVTRYHRLARVITLLLLTAQRRGELALARWRQVDLKARSWTIPPENSKTGKGHVVPLSTWAANEFRRLKRSAKRSPWVLPNAAFDGPIDPKLLTRGLARCGKRLAAAKIEPFTLHDLRRTCRTGLARLKIPPHIAERVLNHAQEKIAGTYDTHDYLDEKREALDKWAAHLEGLRP